MSAARKAHPIESLSFVTDRAPHSRTNVRRCFWNVQPTGDYGEDCKTGDRLALEYLRFERAENGHTYLGWIVQDMPPKHTGIEVSFLHVVGRAAMAGLHEAERLVAHYEHAEMERTHGALVNQRPDGSVVIEQPDGTRAVYRREVGTHERARHPWY